MAYVLAVDDDPEVLGTLERVLRRERLEIGLATSGEEALDILAERTPDLLILDIIMSGIDGLEVCRRLRRDPRYIRLPILFLTAKGSTDDIVNGLDAGGDDYVVKPFELSELRARVHALLRRGMRDVASNAILEIDDLVLDSNSYQAEVVGKRIQLTSTEHRLLRHLMENVDQAQTLHQLLEAVWDYPPNTGDPDLVRAHVRNLRAKIELNPRRKYIRTVHGVGYMFSSTG